MGRRLPAASRVSTFNALNAAAAELDSSSAPAIARVPVAARGVFMGYDFHLTASGPKLIEINTNAGGGLLNAYLLAAHGEGAAGATIRAAYVEMFREE